MSPTILLYTNHACLVAQSRISSMNEAFREQSSFNLAVVLPFVGIVIGAILLGLGIQYYYNARQQRLSSDNPTLLFYELCAAHSLSWQQRRALRRLSIARKLSSPASLFLDIRLWPTNGEAERLLGGRTRRRLGELRRNLFQSLSAE